jgi:hypothetical protein
MSNVLVRWSGTKQGLVHHDEENSCRKRWKINEIFQWDGKCLWHSTSYYATAETAAPATYDSLMGIKCINFQMVFGLSLSLSSPKNLIYAF